MADKRAGAAESQQHRIKPSRKNGWDEHRLVIFANPPTFAQGRLAETATWGGGPKQATGRTCSPTQSRRATAGCPHPRLRTAARASR